MRVDESEVASRIGAEIRRLRTKAGLSTRQLADEAGISQPFLSQVERGVSSPSMVTTYRLAEALGVLPGALLPVEESSLVNLLRADEGRKVAVSSRPDAAAGRILLMERDNPLETVEYVIEPGQYLSEWFELDGELAVYLVSGELEVEVEGVGTWLLHPRDLLSHRATLRHRWTLIGEQPAHVLYMRAQPVPVPGSRRLPHDAT